MTTAVIGLTVLLPLVQENALTFGVQDLDRVPAGWEATQSGEGGKSKWRVVKDKSASAVNKLVLAQQSESPKAMFNLCVLTDSSYRDLEASVRLKAVSGKIDQGGGIMWRYRDAKNYYVARYNPLESNFRVYKVVDGKRTQLETKEDLTLPAGEWLTLGIRMMGDKITCSINGTVHLEVKDSSNASSGKIGLWTKADAVTSFDALTVKGQKSILFDKNGKPPQDR